MAMLTVNNRSVPAPSSLSLLIEDVGAGVSRSASGLALTDRVGIKRRLYLTWAQLSLRELAGLLGDTYDTAFFTVSYPDPLDGAMREMQCCCEKRTLGLMRMDGEVPLWTDVEMEWVEK